VILSSIADLAIIPTLAIGGVLMEPLPAAIVASIFVGALLLAFVLDMVKAAIFARLDMT
jgi:hypothetical protein